MRPRPSGARMVLRVPPKRRLPTSDGMALSVYSQMRSSPHGWLVLTCIAAMLVGCADNSSAVALHASNATHGSPKVQKKVVAQTAASSSAAVDPKLPEYTL